MPTTQTPRTPKAIKTTKATAPAVAAEVVTPRPAAEAVPSAPKGKLGTVVQLLSRPEGATIAQMMSATGWQAHSVRGVMSGAIKKKLKLEIASEKLETGRVYRMAPSAE